MSCNILSPILALESVGGMTHSCITAKKKSPSYNLKHLQTSKLLMILNRYHECDVLKSYLTSDFPKYSFLEPHCSH